MCGVISFSRKTDFLEMPFFMRVSFFNFESPTNDIGLTEREDGFFNEYTERYVPGVSFFQPVIFEHASTSDDRNSCVKLIFQAAVMPLPDITHITHCSTA